MLWQIPSSAFEFLFSFNTDGADFLLAIGCENGPETES